MRLGDTVLRMNLTSHKHPVGVNWTAAHSPVSLRSGDDFMKTAWIPRFLVAADTRSQGRGLQREPLSAISEKSTDRSLFLSDFGTVSHWTNENQTEAASAVDLR